MPYQQRFSTSCVHLMRINDGATGRLILAESVLQLQEPLRQALLSGAITAVTVARDEKLF